MEQPPVAVRTKAVKSDPSPKTVGLIAVGILALAAAIVVGLHNYLSLPYHDLIKVVDVILIIVVVVEIAALQTHKKTIEGSVNVTGKAVEAIGSSVRLLERDKIYLHLVETAQNAQKYIHHLSFAQSGSETADSEERERVNKFLGALERACKTLRGGKENDRPDVKILGPDLSAKIGGLWERQVRGCEVRVSPLVMEYDIRIQVVDGRTVVIGMGPFGHESATGFLVQSYILADLLNDKFMKLWCKAKPLEDLTTDVIMRHVELDLPLEMLRKIIMEPLCVTSETILEKIMDLLLKDKRCLIKAGDGSFVYRTELIRELQRQLALSDEELKHYLLEKGIDMSNRKVEEFIELVRGPSVVDAEKSTTYTSLVNSASDHNAAGKEKAAKDHGPLEKDTPPTEQRQSGNRPVTSPPQEGVQGARPRGKAMSTIYICAPHRLFEINHRVASALKTLGNTVYLPAELCEAEDAVGDAERIRQKCIQAIEDSDVVLCYLDDYGMDSAWELGYAEKAGKEIVGLSLDHDKLNTPKTLTPHTVWDFWMHGWNQHVQCTSIPDLSPHVGSKVVYLSIPVRCDDAINQIDNELKPRVTKIYTPHNLLDPAVRSTTKESWHTARHQCIEAIEASDVVIAYLDDYGMDSAWELGYAEKAGKKIIGLSLDQQKLNSVRQLRPQTVWDYWMHGWKEHTFVQGINILSELFDCSRDFKIPVICPIIERHQNGSVEILIQERAKQSDRGYYGVIEIPGGKIRKDETIIDALKREVREECGLDVIPSKFTGQHDYRLHESSASLFEPFAVTEETGDHSFIGIFAVCEVVGGSLIETEEGKRQRWVSLAELDRLLTTEEILPVIAPGLAKYLRSMKALA